MILRIELERFGKFSGASFALGEVTLFWGPNESGKTTILDAMLLGLCRPSRAKKAGQALAARYGENVSVSLAADGPLPRLDPEVFMNLMAVSSGDLHVELTEGARWLDAVKADLFSGGMDPLSMARLLRKEASDARSTTQGKRLAESRAELERARAGLEEILSRRASILERETELARSSLRLAELDRGLAGSRAELSRLSTALRQQELHEQRRRSREAVAAVDESEAAEAALRGLERFAVDETAALTELEREAGEAEEAARSRAQEAGQLALRIGELVAERDRLGERLELARSRAESAVRLEATLASSSREGGRRGRRALLGTVAVLSLLAGALSLALLEPPASFLAGAAGALLAALALLLAWKTGGAQAARARATAREEWRRETGEEIGDPATEASAKAFAEAFAEELLRRRLGAEAAEAELARAEGELARLRGLQVGVSGSNERARLEAARASRALEGWLRDRGCRDSKEFAASRARWIQGMERRQRAAARVTSFLHELGVASAAELRAECSVGVGALDRSITDLEIDAPARRRLAVRLQELERLAEGQAGERARLLGAVADERGQIKGSLGDLPERIRAAEEEIERREIEARGIETGMKACSVAAGLFEALSRDAEAGLRALAREIQPVYGDIIAARAAPAGDREGVVKLRRLGLDDAAVPDGGGELRPYESLSQGTRDAFTLAARLALAARAHRGPGILVLDEPFLALDRDRTLRACRVLDRFRERLGWQMVILTKDPALLQGARSVFGERLVVHELSRAAAPPGAVR